MSSKDLEATSYQADAPASSQEQNGSIEAAASGPVITRRKFLQILGTGSAAGVAAGCAKDQTQNIFPYVKGEANQVPGVAVWYRSTCTECSAGCGIQVRTREGRAVKVEGNPDSPINKGGLCGLGQASLQSLYDPDRVRQPLMRESKTSEKAIFKPISWDDAYARIQESLGNKGQKKAILTGELSGALSNLVSDWADSLGLEHVTYDSTSPTVLAKACEMTYGEYGVPHFAFDKAEAVVNFGADFLETWISPCEYARSWAVSRRSAKPLKMFHVEPRLSLTGANADSWLMNNPGTEILLAQALLKLMLDKGHGRNLRDEVRDSLADSVAKVDLENVSAASGVSVEKILLMANALHEAKASLVLAGGVSSSTDSGLSLNVLVNFLNLVLGNVGTTVVLGGGPKPKTDIVKLRALIDSMRQGETRVLFVYGTNPEFTLPSSWSFGYAAKAAQVGVDKAQAETRGLVVALASHLDETAELADIILPVHTGLESWGDVRNINGVYGLIQPSMTPVFDTRQVGDILIGLESGAGKSAAAQGSADFKSYLQASWKKLHASAGLGTSFDRFWLESLERGGYFPGADKENRPKVSVSSQALKQKFALPKFISKDVSDSDGLVFYPYPSVKSFDGRAANRPWLQELPDPITSVLWDAWAEMHPDTAKQRGIEGGDMVNLRNFYGEMNLPVYITPYVAHGIIAVPLGQGHKAYGRFAKKVGGGNAYELVSDVWDKNSVHIPLVSVKVDVKRGVGQSSMIKTMGSDSQKGRDIAKTSFIGAAAHGAHGHGGSDAHHHHGPIKQMYEQREHPLYRWGMAVDLSTCTGCAACVVACSAENNIAVVGKNACSKGREMSWLRIERYLEGPAEELQVSFLPMMCQHCGNAPCEPVCPVYATYHNEEGLNAMVYNRCVGTRYCSNNCAYKVRRFNWYEYDFPETLTWQLNPDVSKRGVGVMEKCTFCVQRINEAKDHAKDEGRLVKDGEVSPACVQSCPTQALAFGNLNDPHSRVSQLAKHQRAYKVLDNWLNTQPAVSYLERVKYKI